MRTIKWSLLFGKKRAPIFFEKEDGQMRTCRQLRGLVLRENIKNFTAYSRDLVPLLKREFYSMI